MSSAYRTTEKDGAVLARVFSLVIALSLCIGAGPLSGHAEEKKQSKSASSPKSAPERKSPERKSIDEERLNILRTDIQRELEQYKKLRKELDDTKRAVDAKEQERLMKVAKIYEAMRPEEAANTLTKLDERTAVDILGALKPKTAGKILSQMESDKAAALSQKLLAKEKVSTEKGSR